MRGAIHSNHGYKTALSVAHLILAVLVSLLGLLDLFGPAGRYWNRGPDCRMTTRILSATAPTKEYVDDEQRYLPLPDTTKRTTHMIKFDSELKWEAWDLNTTAVWESMLPAYPLGQDDGFNEGIPYGLDGTTDEDRDAAKSEAQLAHIGHCFNWIRQALLCHADRHREVMLKSPTHGKTEKYARTCGDLDALYDEVGYRG